MASALLEAPAQDNGLGKWMAAKVLVRAEDQREDRLKSHGGQRAGRSGLVKGRSLTARLRRRFAPLSKPFRPAKIIHEIEAVGWVTTRPNN